MINDKSDNNNNNNNNNNNINVVSNGSIVTKHILKTKF